MTITITHRTGEISTRETETVYAAAVVERRTLTAAIERAEGHAKASVRLAELEESKVVKREAAKAVAELARLRSLEAAGHLVTLRAISFHGTLEGAEKERTRLAGTKGTPALGFETVTL